MSRILALDTSTDACSVALSLDGEIQHKFVIEPRRHTHLLLPMVEEVLAEAGVKLASLDAIAFGRGPGSFAGIRIATGAAQGLALGADLPLLPVSTLAAMAVTAKERFPQASRVATALDARMDEVYWGAFDISADLPRALIDESVRSPRDLELPEAAEWLGVGSGWRYSEQMPEALTATIKQVDQECYPDARAMLVLAGAQLAAGEGLLPEDALPVYLREGSWKKKDQQ
ncbi:tRNA (adenosine(37)-N6)-threonylcarbamoyltransferase complex dimerization subunit type 1 TsaB [Marinobacterium mangrovicola]|uniref:tRNA threonylcarbamoyladenosine biosynthesis protein TsaB n=1 Tax=Marinobacterium mangrovicola TaxID=1476959 RepID=A0A4R1G9C8_9GAMM|nr:tRNA (adenosine(37)-N6)-threonylcarbamoyltransferase complex dimerization subunit type 1 TsaB [Marinobacterium mangrovicola]TCK03115.1 tRNA threonylcarbamoyladenosine biosynthesis protein TsaB [Marinobacterium mangrovicola]